MMTSSKRSRDLWNDERRSFGVSFPNNVVQLGTKSDVHTFFLVLRNLEAEGMLTRSFPTISRDLYSTLINETNVDVFEEETRLLKAELESFSSKKVDWDMYDFNRILGEFDYQDKRIDPSKDSLYDVFERFFMAFERAPRWIKKYSEKGHKDFPRLVVCPTEILSVQKFSELKDNDFLAARSSPLWLREPG